MSYTFTILSKAPPSRAALIEALAIPDLDVAAADGGDWDTVVHLSRVGRSTRSTELSWNDGSFDVRLLSLASPEDGELALRVVEVVAALAGQTTVEADGDGEIPVATLRETHGAAWIESLAESGAHVVAALIRDGRGPIKVPGPRRSFYLGPRTLARLEQGPAAEPLHRRLIELIRRVQWLDEATFPAAGIFEATSGDGPAFTFAVWMGEPIFFPAVDRALLDVKMGKRDEGEPEVFLIPSASVAALAGSHFTPFDERQGTIAAFSREAWTELIASARAVRVS